MNDHPRARQFRDAADRHRAGPVASARRAVDQGKGRPDHPPATMYSDPPDLADDYLDPDTLFAKGLASRPADHYGWPSRYPGPAQKPRYADPEMGLALRSPPRGHGASVRARPGAVGARSRRPSGMSVRIGRVCLATFGWTGAAILWGLFIGSSAVSVIWMALATP